MNKLMKNIDIKLFLICIFIVGVMSLYAGIQNVNQNIQPSAAHEQINIRPEVEINYQSRQIIILAVIIMSVLIFFIGFIYFICSFAKNKNNTDLDELHTNINQYINKIEKDNKEIGELKDELNEQKELLNKSSQKVKSIEKKYNSVLETASTSLFEWNITENVVTLSDWIVQKFGIKSSTISSKEFLELMPEDSRETYINALYEYIERKKGFFNIEQKYRLKDGSFEWFKIMAKGIFSDEGLMVKIFGSIEDINNQKLSAEKIKKLEYTDYLTGLPNKADFLKKIDIFLNTRKQKEKIFMFLIDVDDLGIINNEVGNGIGDEILKVVANRIRSSISDTNYIARVGGDEFIILAFNLDNIDSAHKKIMRIIREFDKPFFVNDYKYYMTASIGVVVIPDDGLDSEFLLKNVTEAMYKAKAVGKNTYSFYTESINQEIIKKLDMSNDIKKGIEKKEFFLNYQPQYNIETGKIVGFEALLRWKHPTKGIIYPIDFMSAAEESGLIVFIGEQMMMQACKQAQSWYENGFTDIVVSINISLRQFYDKNFYNMLKNITDLKIVRAGQINFEIGEELILQDTAYIINLIAKILQLGFTFSIHNVGNNLMSIINIENLPIKCIKLSKAFVQKQLQSDTGKALTSILIKLAYDLKFEIIAEGVETEEQADFLKDNNCNIAQGYYFSKAVSDIMADELLEKEFLI